MFAKTKKTWNKQRYIASK